MQSRSILSLFLRRFKYFCTLPLMGQSTTYRLPQIGWSFLLFCFLVRQSRRAACFWSPLPTTTERPRYHRSGDHKTKVIKSPLSTVGWELRCHLLDGFCKQSSTLVSGLQQTVSHTHTHTSFTAGCTLTAASLFNLHSALGFICKCRDNHLHFCCTDTSLLFF